MASSEAFRKFAEECFALAKKASDPNDKLRLVEMAQAWLELGERVSTSQNGGTRSRES
jgi:hypothetical protein